MDGRLKDISDPFIVKSSEITISHDKVGAGNFADVYKDVISSGDSLLVFAVIMDGRLKDISDPFIVKSSEITISHDKVGAGNFADVYKGILRRDKGQKEVAVKIVRLGGGNIGNAFDWLAEMSNEALIMSLHNHRGIIEFFGVSTDKIPMIVMEYCIGGSLDIHLRRFKEHILSAERIRYLYEISSAMRYLERKQCVHRDLATRNVLISADGFLRICDFGLSRCPLVAPPKDSGSSQIPIRWMAPESLTRNPVYSNKSDVWSYGVVIYEIPIRWMAPESLTRNPVYSNKSDVWSYGVVIYEIFNCGKKPWPEKPVKWIATKIRRGITPELPKRMPRLVREVVNSCFKHDPSERPTFKQLNGRIELIQNLRFPSPDVRLLTLSKLRGVNPTSAISEIDPEAICIELEDKEGEKSVVVSYATRSIIPVSKKRKSLSLITISYRYMHNKNSYQLKI
uniref:Protein kinase domain-containing protein n=1 Tax=Ascaris lumbricoides TaxID=6252 RepID=A0A0M3I7U9_ASCLU